MDTMTMRSRNTDYPQIGRRQLICKIRISVVKDSKTEVESDDYLSVEGRKKSIHGVVYKPHPPNKVKQTIQCI